LGVGGGGDITKQNTNRKQKTKTKKPGMWRCQETQMKAAEHNTESRHKERRRRSAGTCRNGNKDHHPRPRPTCYKYKHDHRPCSITHLCLVALPLQLKLRLLGLSEVQRAISLAHLGLSCCYRVVHVLVCRCYCSFSLYLF
jgi:hypothetical protein